MIGHLVAHYRIVRPLGEGGMGVVYVAEDTKLHRKVAIKMLRGASADPIARERLWREARAAAATMPIDDKKADKALNDAFKSKADVKAKHESEWDAFAKTGYGKARTLAEQALAATR
jgi:serine/threonine protein kinase